MDAGEYRKKGFGGSFEILERNKQSLLEALFYIMLPPPPLGHPPIVR
jgi:hypothetical protein